MMHGHDSPRDLGWIEGLGQRGEVEVPQAETSTGARERDPPLAAITPGEYSQTDLHCGLPFGFLFLPI